MVKVSEVVITGGASRVPKLQQMLHEATKLKLSKVLNADEAVRYIILVEEVTESGQIIVPRD